MSARGLMDHRATLWRPVEVIGTLRTRTAEYERLCSAPAAVSYQSSPLANVGPGQAPAGTRTVYLPAGSPAVLGDIIELACGPNAVQHWEVVEPPVHQRRSHLEIKVRPWVGTPPGATA